MKSSISTLKTFLAIVVFVLPSVAAVVLCRNVSIGPFVIHVYICMDACFHCRPFLTKRIGETGDICSALYRV
jgi:hypothetical protein